MTKTELASAFAAFREAVFDDYRLLLHLRPPLEREAYVAHVVMAGAARGFVFDGAAVRAALREGEETWLFPGAEVA